MVGARRFLLLLGIALGVALIAVWPALAATKKPAPPAPELSDSRYAALRKGIMIPHWFTGNKNLAVNELDIRQLREDGFTYVRLPLDPTESYWGAGKAQPSAYTKKLDTAIRQIHAYGLAVVLTFQTFADSDWQTRLANDDAVLEAAEETWAFLAHRYSAHDPEKLFFEILNEPRNVFKFTRWNEIQERLHKAIRIMAARQTIIATGMNWSRVSALWDVAPLQDPNVVYAFHLYDFPGFAFQGAHFVKPELQAAHDIPYPSPQMGLTRAKLESLIREAADWGKIHKVRMTMTEFGVSQKAPKDSIAAYLRDIRTLLDAQGIGWCVWEYSGPDAALFTGASGARKPVDRETFRALGLRVK